MVRLTQLVFLLLLAACGGEPMLPTPPEDELCRPVNVYPCVAEISLFLSWPCHTKEHFLCAECQPARVGCYVDGTDDRCVEKCALCNPYPFVHCEPQGGRASHVIDQERTPAE